MLVLTRRVGESVVIGDDVVVTVLEVRADGVRLGIDAPRHVRVHRSEVLDAVREANAAAAQAGDADATAAAALRDLLPGHRSAPRAAGVVAEWSATAGAGRAV
ncbi:MAG: carbon storage regulator CsrA, partial [Cellulomonas iranensis]|uniref:carbon storage regulator CsrA n=1 Tax=Cellulomonas iranensis TaxID=76862 RepID=UPI001B03FF30